MREVRASHAKTHLSQLLDEVERGETLVITRHGRPIARILPAAQDRRENIGRIFAEIEDFRLRMPQIALADLLTSRHDGHRY